MAGPYDEAAAGDRAVMALAARQHGVVTIGQLSAAGLGRSAVRHRVRQARLRRLHRGVYLVGPVVPPHAAEMAAVLGCGGSAVVSHRSAAALWEILPAESAGIVDVSVAGYDARSRPGVRVHRVRTLAPTDVACLEGIPVTAPDRTLVDLAPVLPAHELERAVEEAQVRQLVTAPALAGRARGRTGAPALRAALRDDPALTRSEAERRLLRLIRAARLPAPATNVRVGRHEVDLLWREERLVVEVDGYAFHSSRAAFERDRVRDGELQAAGYRVLRVTWRQVTGEPEAVIARIAALLAR